MSNQWQTNLYYQPPPPYSEESYYSYQNSQPLQSFVTTNQPYLPDFTIPPPNFIPNQTPLNFNSQTQAATVNNSYNNHGLDVSQSSVYSTSSSNDVYVQPAFSGPTQNVTQTSVDSAKYTHKRSDNPKGRNRSRTRSPSPKYRRNRSRSKSLQRKDKDRTSRREPTNIKHQTLKLRSRSSSYTQNRNNSPRRNRSKGKDMISDERKQILQKWRKNFCSTEEEVSSKLEELFSYNHEEAIEQERLIWTRSAPADLYYERDGDHLKVQKILTKYAINLFHQLRAETVAARNTKFGQ